MDQLNLFVQFEKAEQAKREDQLYREWCNLPEETPIASGSPEREKVVSVLRSKRRLFGQATHVCSSMPTNIEIWLYEIELPEYWVVHEKSDPCGEHIEKCPYCGAILKNMEGDVVLHKAGPRAWGSKQKEV